MTDSVPKLWVLGFGSDVEKWGLRPGLSVSRVRGSLTPAWAIQAGYVPHRLTVIKFLARQKLYTSKIVTWCGTYPARVAQAGVRLPPTLEADKPG